MTPRPTIQSIRFTIYVLFLLGAGFLYPGVDWAAVRWRSLVDTHRLEQRAAGMIRDLWKKVSRRLHGPQTLLARQGTR